MTSSHASLSTPNPSRRGRHGPRTVLLGLVALLAATAAALGPVSARAQNNAAAAPAAPSACPPTAQMPTPAQIQAAQAAARDRGFLWRISKGGRSSYLYGTIHIGKLDWAFPGPRLLKAFSETDTLALELDVSDPAVLRELNQAIASPNYAAALPVALEQRMARQSAAACLPPGALDGLHPVMRAITLVMLDARWEGLDPGYGQEFILAGAARARGMGIVSLESAALQMKALLPETDAELAQTVRQTLDQLEAGTSRRASARLANTWADGRLDDLESYGLWCECTVTEEMRSALRRVNDERNPGLADRIAALHESGKTVFAAVGALHMTGAQALPKLLVARGWGVQRVELKN